MLFHAITDMSGKLPQAHRLALGISSTRSSSAGLAARLRRVHSIGYTIADPSSMNSPITSLSARAAWRLDGRNVVAACTNGVRTINSRGQFSICSSGTQNGIAFIRADQRSLLHTSAVRRHGGINRPKPGEGIKLTFRKANGEEKTVEGNEGDDIVDLSWEYDLDIEAACEKSVACSTCHVILEPKVYDALDEPTDEENDMLDLAFSLTTTSRLGCQVKLTPAMHNSIINLPSATRNMNVDGKAPKGH